MNHRDFLDLADELSTGNREVDWRSAVSRAYYGVFHTARRLLLACGFEVPDGDTGHAYLWRRLANSGRPDVTDAGREMNSLRGARNWADYDLDRPFDHFTAFDHVRTALKVAELLELAAAEPTVCAAITEAMKTYERDVLREVTWRP